MARMTELGQTQVVKLNSREEFPHLLPSTVMRPVVAPCGDDGLPLAHVGLHAGPVLFREGDYYGRTVNAASRIADYARPGEVVVSQEVVDTADATPASFVEIGPVELKGLSEALRLFTARHDAPTAGS